MLSYENIIMKNINTKFLNMLNLWSFFLTVFSLIIILFILLSALIEIGLNGIETFENVFIIKLIKLHGGIIGEKSLFGVNALDMIILILLAIMCIFIFPILIKCNKIGKILLLIQPFLGIILYIITQETGRTLFFTTNLTLSLLLINSDIVKKKVAYIGIVANMCLLIPDISLAFIYSFALSIVMSIGFLFEILFYIFFIWKLLSQKIKKKE